MSIKGLLFSLSMYVGLVWVAGAYLNPGPSAGAKIRQFGLFWTGVGLAATLAWIIGARLFAWLRTWRSKATTRKDAAPKAAEPSIHEDDAALLALVGEANAALAKAPAYAGVENPLSTLPVYLLVGPENSGKTSAILNSGLEPQMLAGQVTTAGPVSATRIANIWLVQGVALIEVAGRLFSGEGTRWLQFFKTLEGSTRPAPNRWDLRRFWREPAGGLKLNAAIAFHDVKGLSGNPDAERISRETRLWQDRLAAIGEAFGVEFPVYTVITKCDSIAFFDDYFRRMPEPEARQAIGCTLERVRPPALRPNETAADQESKRLSSAFTGLYHALADRRTAHLAHEPDMKRRPGVYEFPRELKRIRAALVQFLTESFRPNPLRLGPVLRGFYFTGTREEEAMAAEVAGTRAEWSLADAGADATRLFRGDATQILQPDDLRQTGRGGTTRRWMFTSDLFLNIVLPDRPARRVQRPRTALDRYRIPMAAATFGVCGILCAVWIYSWMGNREMLSNVERVTELESGTALGGATGADLKALDALRIQVQDLANWERGHPPLSLRWGLYAGRPLAEAARKAYFRRFQQLLLNDLNGALVAELTALPANPGPNVSYDPVYRMLATHLMISSAACKPDAGLVGQVLKQTAGRIKLAGAGDNSELVGRQIDFYADELRYGNPCRVTENAEARDRGRQYLANIKGVERIYAAIIASVEKTIGNPTRLSDLAANYGTVLSGPNEMPGAFTVAGWPAVEKAAAQGRAGEFGDSCIVGGGGGTQSAAAPNEDVAREILKRFARDYAERWRNFVSGFSVIRYSGPEDAARRLTILSEHKSPLLAMLYMTARQTNFPAPVNEPSAVDKFTKPVLDAVAGIAGGKGTSAKPVAEVQPPQAEITTAADITRTFQPVHIVVPPQSDTWVTEKNSAYVEALAQLGRAMRDVGRANTDPAAQQAAAQAYDRAMDAVRQVSRMFKPVGVEGIDSVVQRLLEQPILLTRGYLIDPEKAIAGKINGELRTLCASVGATLRKYPFSPAGEDASLQEIAAAFAPASGAVWKYQAQYLPDLVVREGTQWKPKDPAKKPQLTAEMVAFLTHAQKLADVFYSGGGSQPALTYTFRPRMDSNTSLQLEVDGQKHEWVTGIQKQFTWPAQPGAKDAGAVVTMRVGPARIPVASRGGQWGIFRVLADAEPRPLGSKLVEWKRVRGGGGRLEPIDPPARLEIVEFPGGADVFNPKFFEGVSCPGRAVQ